MQLAGAKTTPADAAAAAKTKAQETKDGAYATSKDGSQLVTALFDATKLLSTRCNNADGSINQAFLAAAAMSLTPIGNASLRCPRCVRGSTPPRSTPPP